MMRPETNKKALAAYLGVSRSTLYYRPRREEKDWKLKTKIEQVLHQHPSYGHRRIAQEIGRNKKPVQRVMKLYGIKPYRRRRISKYKRKTVDLSNKYPNLLLSEDIFPRYPHHIWTSDFTYLPFKGRFVYLATILDLFTREIVGFNVLTVHNKQLVIGALLHAASNYPLPQIIHSDQGREYTSKDYLNLVKSLNIRTSLSRKGSPWENGYQEGFYSQFKVDLGDPSRFNSLGELVYNVFLTIYTYNNKRIHSALKMPPKLFAERHQAQRSPCVICV